MNQHVLDTNVILRFLLEDIPDQAEQAARLFRAADAGQCRLMVPSIVVAEVVYVLSSFYEADRAHVCQAIRGLLGRAGVQTDEPDVMALAVEKFDATTVSFTDAYLAARCELQRTAVATFDLKLQRLSGPLALDWAEFQG